MCPGALSRGGCVARWTQIDAIARADMAWRHLEWRLPCQVICRKGGQRPCTAVCGSSETFRQIIARADVPWSDAWRGSRCSMDTNRCHRASRYGLEAPRMAIAVPGDLQESVGPGPDGRAWQFGELRRASGKTSREPMCLVAMSRGVRGARWTQIGAIARADMPCRPLEWRLPCQMNCRKVWDRALTAVCGSSESFRQTIA